MAMDFSAGAGQGSSSDLIPNGQLAFAVIGFRGVKLTQAPNKDTGKHGQYVDLELTFDDNQPFARRKVWHKLSDPLFPDNSEAARQRGMADISRILEIGNNAGPNNQAGYQIPDYSALHGKRVAIKVGIKKGDNGFADQNKVADFLTCNPTSSTFKTYEKLLKGEFNVGGVSAPAAPAQQAFPGFGATQAAAATAAPVVGFGAASAVAQTGGGFQVTQAAAFAVSAPQVSAPAATGAASPSNPAQPAWLAQANGA